MKINELAKRSGIMPETIRYYEKIGLLPKPERLANGYRIYSPQILADLNFIKSCRSLGFSLEDTQALQQLKHSQTTRHEADLFVQKQLEHINQKMAELQSIQQFLERIQQCDQHHAEQCCTLSHLEKPLTL